jgi:hypothetical protein
MEANIAQENGAKSSRQSLGMGDKVRWTGILYSKWSWPYGAFGQTKCGAEYVLKFHWGQIMMMLI